MAEKKREKSVDVLDRLFWTVQPPMGLVKGDYYRAENWFAPHFPGDKGYHGILEVVRRDGTLQMVEFNEINNPTSDGTRAFPSGCPTTAFCRPPRSGPPSPAWCW